MQRIPALQILTPCDIFRSGDDMKNKLKGTAALLFATVIWGSAFIAQSVGMDHISPFTFQAVRCFLAAAFLAPLSYILEPDRKNFWNNWKDKQLWKGGILAGAALAVAAGLQQWGLVYTSPGKAGFLTALYIVLVPMVGLFLKKKPPVTAWLSVAIAVPGLYLLSGTGSGPLNIGDLMLVGGALGFAVQITIIDRYAASLDGVRLNCIQSLVCAVLSAVVMLLGEDVDPAAILDCWLPLGYAGILSMGVAYTLQIVGQKELDPTPASLLMSLESVFALLFGWLLLEERLTAGELLGCGLMFTAVILSQLPQNRAKK